jgi:RNA 3'-phosphate cyclase
MVEIDGSSGEGGGQMLRTSLSLSLLTGKPFHLRHVRAKRSKPGLQPQHLMGVKSAATIGQAKVKGATLGSTDLVFHPGDVQPGQYNFNIGTAGATSLVLHTLYLPLTLAGQPSEVTVQGGTHVRACPCFQFLDTTWRGYLALLGIDIALNMPRPGFYPRGGGLLEANLKPTSQVGGLNLDAVTWDRTATIISAVAGLPEHVRQRQADQARQRLQEMEVESVVCPESWPGGPGSFLGILLQTRPVPTLFFGLGERGKPAERVADEAVDQVAAFLRPETLGIDLHSADQLLLPLALAPGASRFWAGEITCHLLTNATVIRKFVDRKIRIQGEEGAPGWVEVEKIEKS